MRSTRQALRPASISIPKLVTFGSAIVSALAVAACSTEEVPSNAMIIEGAPYESSVALYITRDDSYAADLTPEDVGAYRVMVDGRYLAWDATHYVIVCSNGSYEFTLPAGEHVVSLVDDQGHAAVTSPTVETKPGYDANRPHFRPAIVFFGGPTTMQARVFVDDPAAVPTGSIHARVMNALADHQPVQIVQCPNALDGSRLYSGAECTPVGDTLAHGNFYETDAPLDVVNKLGFYWAAPDAVDPVVAPANLGNAPLTESFITRIPTRVQGAGNGSCPSCLFTEF